MYAMCASEISSCRLLRDEGVAAAVVVVSGACEDKARRRKMRVTEVNTVRMVQFLLWLVYSWMDRRWVDRWVGRVDLVNSWLGIKKRRRGRGIILYICQSLWDW